MDVNERFVERISELSYLKLSPEQIRHYVQQMKKILDYVETLDGLPDEDLEEGWRPDTEGPACPERQDDVKPALNPELATREAPDPAGSSFRVPRVVE